MSISPGGDSGGGDDSGGIWSGDLLSRFPSLKEFASNTSKAGAGAVAAFGAALAAGTDLSAKEVFKLGTTSRGGVSSPGEIGEFLVVFASAPVQFLWGLIYQTFLVSAFELVLFLTTSVIDLAFLILAGDSLALETEGQLGLSDLIYALFVISGGAVATGISLYYDAMVAVSTAIEPSTGTALDAAVGYVVFVALLLVSLTIMYRVLIALGDALPGISGIQTFITGGS